MSKKEKKPKKLIRTEGEIVRDRAEITKLYIQGLTQIEISKRLQQITEAKYLLSREMIKSEIQVILKEWQEQYVSQLDAWKWKEIAKLDNLESVAWDAYYESKKDKLITQENFSGGIDQNQDTQDTPTKKKSYSPYAFSGTTKITNHGGDVRFLAEIRFITKQRIELLGLNAPVKHDVKIKSMFDEMTPEELDKWIEENEVKMKTNVLHA